MQSAFSTKPAVASDTQGNPNLRRLHWLLARPATHVGMGLAILMLDFASGPLLMFPVLFVIPVVLSAQYCSVRLAYALAVLLPIGRFFIAVFVDLPDHIWANGCNALIRIAVLVFMAFLVARNARQAREIKVLKGILPICMFCKRIRTEQHNWQQMETYITLHSEALFNHSICPECAQKNYGDTQNPKQKP